MAKRRATAPFCQGTVGNDGTRRCRSRDQQRDRNRDRDDRDEDRNLDWRHRPHGTATFVPFRTK
jgi:hypothetical protein